MMKKFTVLALLATVIVASPVFAVQRHIVAPNATFAAGSPATTNNSDSCDVGVTPAATLLLPYFEVDTRGGATAANTLFTVTNTSRFPQFVHVTVWTAWSFPVLDFNLFLTGYDVQGVSLFDVIVRGQVPATNPLVPNPTVTSLTAPATAPSATNPNINPANSIGGTAATNVCNPLPGGLPSDLASAVLSALTVGNYSLPAGSVGTACATAGPNNGANTAKGYVTMDLASTCSTQLPTDPAYYTGAAATILFDNVLIGDYEQIGPTPTGSGTTAGSFDAGGNPLVHIRAIPEGGPAGIGGGAPVTTNLPYTFYDRYTAAGARAADRRQPLPSTWAARFIESTTAGFATDFKIWREGVTGSVPARVGDDPTSCALTPRNAGILVSATVRFDEAENATALGANNQICSPCSTSPSLFLPETSRTSSAGGTPIPGFTSGSTALGGWMYLNLSSNGFGNVSGTNPGGTAAAGTTLSRQTAPGIGAVVVARTTSQNWVVVSMFGQGRLSVDFDAAWLANGCTPAPAPGNTAPIAPGSQRSPTPNPTTSGLVCPVGAVGCVAGTGVYIAPQSNP